MDESTDPSVVLIETRLRVPDARPVYRSQPLQAIQEEKEDEGYDLTSNKDDTPPYAIGPPSQVIQAVGTSDEERYPNEDTVDYGLLSDFFTIDEEIDLSLPIPPPAGRGAQFPGRLRNSFRSHVPPLSTRLSRIDTRISLASVVSTDTFLRQDPNQLDPTISLSSLLDVISRHRSLQDARIVQADSYQQFNGRVVHRFIILELERDKRQKIWLRIDRRRDESRGLLSFVANGARAPSDDRAWLSADKVLISEGLDAEHTTMFEDVVPNLGDLRWVFLAIVQVLTRYELFGANCWFMVSFIYECLDEMFHSSAVARFLYLRKGSEEVRREIRTAARLIITFPFEEVPSNLIEQYDGIKNFYNAMLSHHFDVTDETTITSLLRSLFDLRHTIPEHISLHSFLSLSADDLSERFPPHLTRAASQLAPLFDGRKLTEQSSRWHYTFNLFLLNSFGKSPFSREMTPPDLHRLHVATCLGIMNEELHFNVCKFPSSFLRNKDVSDLEARGGANIPAPLRYACRHWADQVPTLETLDPDLVGVLSLFLQTHFLHWLEVMSIIAVSPVEALKNLDAAPTPPSSEELTDMIRDARHFVETFEVPILESVPHIYISALAFTPLSSELFSNLRRFLGQTAATRSRTLYNWVTVTPIIEADPGHQIISLVFSPNGRFLVSGSSNKTLQLWDAGTGDAIGEPLSGHGGPVPSVAFSPDGSRIASASDDRTIRFWDVATRRQIGQPLRGHSGSVWSVTFSPDGTRLFSGSSDSTICQWDAKTGSMIGKPLQGRSYDAHAVGFSPDGIRVVSGSGAKIIRMWDGETGKPIGKPLEGHSAKVWRVAFSPDGTQIVSASEDRIIRRWDVRTGEPIGKPSGKYAGGISCVVFSPDGKWLALGSHDKTVGLWNVHTGETIGEPLIGHLGFVRAVAFSPDGNMFASGANDGTIRFWQCRAGRSDNQPGLALPRLQSAQPSYPLGLKRALHASSHIPQQSPSSNVPPRETLTLMENGWIMGPNDKLILWLPLGLRYKMPFDEWAGVDQIDWTNFGCGAEWTDCWGGAQAV